MPLANKHNQKKITFQYYWRENVGRDYGNVMTSNYSVEGNINWDCYNEILGDQM